MDTIFWVVLLGLVLAFTLGILTRQSDWSSTIVVQKQAKTRETVAEMLARLKVALEQKNLTKKAERKTAYLELLNSERRYFVCCESECGMWFHKQRGAGSPNWRDGYRFVPELGSYRIRPYQVSSLLSYYRTMLAAVDAEIIATESKK